MAAGAVEDKTVPVAVTEPKMLAGGFSASALGFVSVAVVSVLGNVEVVVVKIEGAAAVVMVVVGAPKPKIGIIGAATLPVAAVVLPPPNNEGCWLPLAANK